MPAGPGRPATVATPAGSDQQGHGGCPRRRGGLRWPAGTWTVIDAAGAAGSITFEHPRGDAARLKAMRTADLSGGRSEQRRFCLRGGGTIGCLPSGIRSRRPSGTGPEG